MDAETRVQPAVTVQRQDPDTTVIPKAIDIRDTTVHQPVVTPTPPSAAEAQADRPRELQRRTTDDNASLIGSLVGAFGFVWLLYTQVLPYSGKLGFVLLWFACFLALYVGVTAMSQPRTIVFDRLASAVLHGAALIVLFALATTVIYTFVQGRRALPHLNFFTDDMAGVRPTSGLDQGGILHAVAGTFIQLGIAILISLPLGVICSVYMVEVGGRFARIVRTVVEAMTALPDILAGLFVYTVLILALGYNRSGLAAAIALAVTMLPIIARAGDVVLRVVPGGLREAGLALGASQWQTVWRVVLPTARPGLATALILGSARAVGETAPLLLTTGASTFLNTNPLEGPMNSLPLFIFASVRSGQENAIARGFGAASVLLALVLVLFVTTRLLARQRVGRR